ncbi:NAD(P) transhydrogenase subunit alpha [Trebonia kvetii]|uniref:proton-translocating NAD(P)(+) transhydrogenase n=1 Tax=Trebonia kvetii TaxID=2480626 RepID=A0A6P2C155_9ACTN|nr:NAD(P) transhydrogenase subunit alpha [Trebonia kvetii]TVZ05122.1 NAD(P) transhydrogenase subunit alpha [Trebonia kvetii]
MTTIGVVRETTPGERRVALVPDVVARLRGAGMEVLIEAGAGRGARFPDGAYIAAGATVTTAGDVYGRADVLACVSPPIDAALHSGQVLLGLLQPLARPDLIRDLAGTGVTAISLDLIPRTLSRAQPMDALTSQASVAGYKAALVAADAYGGYLPMMMTAAGTVKPATVLVLGAGVAGLQAIGTARRLGAVVTGYDVRPETRQEIASLGARFLDLGTAVEAAGAGGYARELTAAERDAQQRALDERIAGFDIVITTAAVPGRRPPVLVTEQALKGMRPGSVLVDMASGPLGGNVALSQPDTTVEVGDGVTVIGAGSLPAQMPAAASTAYARNVGATLEEFVRDGALTIDLDDELRAAIVVAHDGKLLNAAVRALLEKEGSAA